MIFGNVKNLNEFDYLKDNIKKCFEYAKANDLNTYEKGTYKIDGEPFCKYSRIHNNRQ